MKNPKLKLALKSVKNDTSKNFRILGIEEIQTVKGGTKPVSAPGCTSTNCPNTNCGWN